MGDKKEIKLLVFLDDNETSKDKHVEILERDEYGIRVQFYDTKKKEAYPEIEE